MMPPDFTKGKYAYSDPPWTCDQVVGIVARRKKANLEIGQRVIDASAACVGYYEGATNWQLSRAGTPPEGAGAKSDPMAGVLAVRPTTPKMPGEATGAAKAPAVKTKGKQKPKAPRAPSVGGGGLDLGFVAVGLGVLTLILMLADRR